MQRLMMATEAGKRHQRGNQNWHLAIWLQSLFLNLTSSWGSGQTGPPRALLERPGNDDSLRTGLS